MRRRRGPVSVELHSGRVIPTVSAALARHPLLVLLILLLVAALPAWPWSRAWGYFGAGGIGALLLLLALLIHLGVV